MDKNHGNLMQVEADGSPPELRERPERNLTLAGQFEGHMIEDHEPMNWEDLEIRVGAILSETGVEVVLKKKVETARGGANIDVWAHDDSATPSQTYLIECKHWRRRVTKNVVHGFRTVVGDSGANWGAIISMSGFQKGAQEAANYSNVRLLTWRGFQELFVSKWFNRYFLPTISQKANPLMEYTEPINSRIFKKADDLSTSKRRQFNALRQRYFGLSLVCLLFSVRANGSLQVGLSPKGAKNSIFAFELLKTLNTKRKFSKTVPNSILEARSLRSLLNATILESDKAAAEFDSVFRGRA